MTGSTNDSVLIDDLPKLTAIASEWIEKLLQFGKVYAVAMPRALLLRGQLLMLTGRGNGKARAATAQLRKSLACARKQLMPYDEGLALYELGKHAAHPSDGLRYLTQALDNFTRTGAVYDQKRAEQQIEGRKTNKSASSLLVTLALQPDGSKYGGEHNISSLEETEADEGEAGADNGEVPLSNTETTPRASARGQPGVSEDSTGESSITSLTSVESSQQESFRRTGSKVSFSWSQPDGNVRL